MLRLCQQVTQRVLRMAQGFGLWLCATGRLDQRQEAAGDDQGFQLGSSRCRALAPGRPTSSDCGKLIISKLPSDLWVQHKPLRSPLHNFRVPIARTVQQLC